jgi:hypothetical protein
MSRIKAFGLGLRELFGGFRLFGRHKVLWWYAIIPTVLNLAILTAAIILMVTISATSITISPLDGLERTIEAAGFFGTYGSVYSMRQAVVKGLLFLILAMLVCSHPTSSRRYSSPF